MKPRENILVNVSNIDDMIPILGKKLKNIIKVEMWSESKSGNYILVIRNASYVVFEKSPDDDVHDTPICKYVGSTPIGPEEDNCLINNILWFEHSGCVRIYLCDRFEFRCRPGILVVFDEYAYEFSERKFRTKNEDPKFLKRKKLVRSYLGKTVEILMDRPLGYVHEKEKFKLTYPINYGFIPGVIGGDGKELDVYLLGVDEPVSKCTAKIIGIVHRENDDEDKLVAAPEGMSFTKEEIAAQVEFQEKYYDSFIETADSFFECSLRDCFVDRKLPDELEHYLLNKLLCHCEYEKFKFPSWKEYDSLDEFKPYRDMEESGNMTVCRPEFVCNPRTLFLALWRRYLRINHKLSDKAKINLRFYFSKGNLMMKVDSIDE